MVEKTGIYLYFKIMVIKSQKLYGLLYGLGSFTSKLITMRLITVTARTRADAQIIDLKRCHQVG